MKFYLYLKKNNKKIIKNKDEKKLGKVPWIWPFLGPKKLDKWSSNIVERGTNNFIK